MGIFREKLFFPKPPAAYSLGIYTKRISTGDRRQGNSPAVI
jgi:hypothetical protein